MSRIQENYLRTEKMYIQAVAATVGSLTGLAAGDLLPVPQGYCWRLARYSVHSNSSGTPIFELYVANARNTWQSPNFTLDRTLRLDYTPNKDNVADNAAPPFFDEGEVPLFVWSGGNNGDICQATVMVQWFEKVMLPTFRDAILDQEQDAKEAEVRDEALVVGGSGWAVVPPDSSEFDMTGFLEPWAASEDGQ